MNGPDGAFPTPTPPTGATTRKWPPRGGPPNTTSSGRGCLLRTSRLDFGPRRSGLGRGAPLRAVFIRLIMRIWPFGRTDSRRCHLLPQPPGDEDRGNPVPVVVGMEARPACWVDVLEIGVQTALDRLSVCPEIPVVNGVSVEDADRAAVDDVQGPDKADDALAILVHPESQAFLVDATLTPKAARLPGRLDGLPTTLPPEVLTRRTP